MSALFAASRAAVDALLWPFLLLPPFWGLLLLSAVLGVVLLGAFRLLTPQKKLAVVKDRMSATIYEMRLYSASPSRVLRAQGRAIVLTGAYLLLALPSFLVLVPVMGLVLARASLTYEFQPLSAGQTVVVKAEMDRPLTHKQLTVATTDPGVSLIKPVLLFNGGKSARFRLRADKPGDHAVTLTTAGHKATKRVQVQNDAPVSLALSRGNDWNLLVSGEPALATAGPLSLVTFDYPARDPIWLGLPWWLHLLIVSMVAALALRRRLGVVF